MVTVDKFLAGVDAIEKAAPDYQLGHSGDDGKCDCIGLIIGAIRRAGGKWTGTHGSNYAARFEMDGGLKQVFKASDLERGMAIYKAELDGPNLPTKYRPGGKSYTGDLHDYYHVGVVYSVNPLVIKHCTSGSGNSIHMDTKMGAWRYAGRLKKIQYDGKEEIKMARYMVTADGGVNLRSKATTNSARIGKIEKGQVIDGTPVNDEWLRVNVNGVNGFCMSKFLTEYEDVPADFDDTDGGDGLTLEQRVKKLEERVGSLERSVGASIGLG